MKIKMTINSIYILINLVLLIPVVVSDCYFNRTWNYKYYSSKTTYEMIRGDIRHVHLDAVSECEPISLWSLNRHGTRLAASSGMSKIKKISALKDEIIASHEEGNGNLCDGDIENLRKWHWDDNLDNAESQDLVEEGYKELRNIGSRIKEMFPKLFDNYTENKFYFRTMSKNRTIFTSRVFAEGLFGLNVTVNVDMTEDGDEKDIMLKPYESCELWNKEVKHDHSKSSDAYSETSDYEMVQERVENLLGIGRDLTPSKITALYNICRYEKAWRPSEESPWCAVFTEEDLKVLEYGDDLTRYYRNGYGSPINVKLGAFPLKELFERFSSVKNGTDETRLFSYITRGTTMEMVYSALGLFKDDYVLDVNTRHSDRKWRTSTTGAFANNLIAVLYRCKKNDEQNYKVVFYQNENIVNVCRENWCSWEEFETKFQDYLEPNFEMC